MKHNKEDKFLGIMIIVSLIILLFANLININLIFKFTPAEIESIDFSKHRQLVFDDAFRGSNPNANITFAIFTDFNCPFCAENWQIIRRLMLKYDYDVNFLVKYLVNVNDESSLYNAVAFECAKLNQIEFGLGDLLFSGYKTKQDVELYVSGSGVDIDRFKECVSNPDIHKLIEGDYYHASFLEVKGTPTIFINGIKIEGVKNYEIYEELINIELRENN
jgi:thioredoxin-related protein